MNQHWEQLSAVFHELVDASQEQRRKRLDELGEIDAEMAQELRDLLDHADQTIDFTAETDAAQLLLTRKPEPDSMLGHYRIRRKIGQGGMGVVYLGHRSEDFEQLVAIKLGKMALDSDASDRFLRERQILADLNHPNIARLLDGGTTRAGAPYLVMEYVEGRSIDSYCRDRNLDLISVLKLFQKVCAGVSYAHQHLVIHRDIKPSNILVETSGEPRLLDFGIAKVVEQGEAATLTATHAMTPQYASPEQVRGERTTTLTDVYALGLLLYELLTGQRAQQIKPGNLADLKRVVCDTQVPLLSRALSSVGDAAPLAGQQLRRSGHWLRDLQNIVHRAVAKEVDRRYPSVQALSADLWRMLDGNPVEATGDSLWYRLTKLMRKYRYRTAAIAIAIASIIALTVGLSWSTVVANRARDDAQRRLVQSQDLIGFMLGDLRERLEPKVRLEVLDIVGEKAMNYFATLDPADQSDEALAQTALSLRQIGDVRMSQGAFEEGEAAFRRSMELTATLLERDPNNLLRLFDLGQSYFWIGFAALRRNDYQVARPPFVRYLEISEQLAGSDPDNTDWVLELSYAHNNLGTLDIKIGDTAGARDRFEKSLMLKRRLVAMDPENRGWQIDLSNTLGWLADAEHHLGNLRGALTYRQERMSVMQTLVQIWPGDNRINQLLGYAALTLANEFDSLGLSVDAAQLFRQAIALSDQRAAFDPEHLKWQEDGARARLDLAENLMLTGDLTNARRLLEESQTIAAPLLAQPQPSFVWLRDLGARAAYLEAVSDYLQSRYDLAQIHASDALSQHRALLTDHPDDAVLRRRHIRTLVLLGDIQDALHETVGAERHWQQALGAEHEMAGPSMDGPDDIAARIVAMLRLSRHEEAQTGMTTLASIGYADPWYTAFSGIATPE